MKQHENLDEPSLAWTAEDDAFVRAAAAYLEHPSFLVQLADLVGRPVEAALGSLPRTAQRVIQRAVQGALGKGLEWVSHGLEPSEAPVFETLATAGSRARQRGRRHNVAAAATGAAGGFAGLAAMPIELPISTLILLRTIAATAHEMGADLGDPAVRLECLSVLSLGGPTRRDDAAESGYLTARVGLAGALREAARGLARSGAEDLARVALDRTAPALVRFLALIAGRFEAVVTERAVAQVLPVVGAISGAAINTAFAHHFHRVALYHFGIRQLERLHGAETVEARYRATLGPGPAPRRRELVAAR
ncbi:MAG: EcsC family protein [bacterium]